MSAYYLSLKEDIPANDYWSYGLLNELLSGRLWGEGFDPVEAGYLPVTDRAIVVVPGEYHADVVGALNDELSKVGRVVLFIMADEEAKFPIEQVKHDNIEIWVQYPRPTRHEKYHKLGATYPPQSQDILRLYKPSKDLTVYFSGQVTHDRRRLAYDCILQATDSIIQATEGFTQGVGPAEYYENLVRAKIAPAPAGAVTPDSFRVFEALEAMAIPFADELDDQGEFDSYWDWLFGEIAPFVKVKDWPSFIGYTEDALNDYPNNLHRITAWWIAWKRNFYFKVRNQYEA